MRGQKLHVPVPMYGPGEYPLTYSQVPYGRCPGGESCLVSSVVVGHGISVLYGIGQPSAGQLIVTAAGTAAGQRIALQFADVPFAVPTSEEFLTEVVCADGLVHFVSRDDG